MAIVQKGDDLDVCSSWKEGRVAPIILSHLHLHLVILQTLLSKATYNWGVHKAINLEEANIQRKCQ